VSEHLSYARGTVPVTRPPAPWAGERAVRSARSRVPGLPEAFRFHDLRHYLASLLIDVYGHLWPDSDDRTRAAVAAAFQDRADWVRTERAPGQ